MSEPRTDVPSAQDEVVEICRDLIRIDSSNYGDDSGPGERAAAEYVAQKLAEVGLEPAIFESADRRTSLVGRPERVSNLSKDHATRTPPTEGRRSGL